MSNDDTPDFEYVIPAEPSMRYIKPRIHSEDADEWANGSSIRESIMEYATTTKGGAFTLEDLHKRTEFPVARLISALNTLVEKGLIIRREGILGNVYRLNMRLPVAGYRLLSDDALQVDLKDPKLVFVLQWAEDHLDLNNNDLRDLVILGRISLGEHTLRLIPYYGI